MHQMIIDEFKQDGWTHVHGKHDGYWKQHWIENSDHSWPLKCQVKQCNNSADLGGHVQRLSESRKQWIVPMCYHCNNNHYKKFSLNIGAVLVPVVVD